MVFFLNSIPTRRFLCTRRNYARVVKYWYSILSKKNTVFLFTCFSEQYCTVVMC